MRFRFNGLRRPARVAKLIRRELSAHGVEVGLCRAQDIAAEAFGYGTFRELKALVGRDDPSAWDEDVGDDVRRDRRERQIAALSRAALRRAEAEAVVDRIRPTARRLGGGVAPNPGTAGRHDAVLFVVGDPMQLPDERPWVDSPPDAWSGIDPGFGTVNGAPGTGKSTAWRQALRAIGLRDGSAMPGA